MEGKGDPTHVVTRRQPLDVVESHVDPHHAQDELVLEGRAGKEAGGSKAVTRHRQHGDGATGDGPLLPQGTCGSDPDTAGAQGGMCQPPGSPPWDTAPPRELQLPAVPIEPGEPAKAILGPGDGSDP